MIISRDKSLLYPPFALLVTELERRLLDAGYPFRLFMGLRDWGTQQELYDQGRVDKSKPIVTNAKPGFSWHNYSLACDFVPFIEGAWTWESDQWESLGEIAESLGLEWGGRWKRFPDYPHVQKTYGLTINEAFELYRIGGMKAVWKECDKEA